MRPTPRTKNGLLVMPYKADGNLDQQLASLQFAYASPTGKTYNAVSPVPIIAEIIDNTLELWSLSKKALKRVFLSSGNFSFILSSKMPRPKMHPTRYAPILAHGLM